MFEEYEEFKFIYLNQTVKKKILTPIGYLKNLTNAKLI